MRITGFGASGKTGRHVVRQALGGGHRVTAVVRDPARLPVEAMPALEVVTADVMEPAAIEPTVAGADLVVSALGAKPGAKAQIRAKGAESIAAAMRSAGAWRLAVVTSAGHVKDKGDSRFTRAMVKPLFRTLVRAQFADYAATDAAVMDSDLDWTIARPGWLTNGGHRPFRTGIDHAVPGATSISRADLARFLLSTATAPETVGHAVFLGY
jgi:putative NADH-flavin reductase